VSPSLLILNQTFRVLPVVRLIAASARALAVTAFVWHLAAVAYLPLHHQPFGDADTEAAVRAMNAGHPFYFLYPATENSRQILQKLSERWGDQGVVILMVVGASARQWLTGTPMTVTTSMGWDILMLLFVVAAGAIVAPGVPLGVAMAGMLAFHVLVRWGPIGLGSPVHWGVAFAAVITAVYLGTVLKPWTAWRLVTVILLAALAALAQVLRQEAAGVAYALGAGLLMVAGVADVVGRHSGAEGRRQAWLRPLTHRAIAGGLLLIAANASVQPIERWCIARQIGTSYAETPAIEHGSGFPLYLSLGYVSNPFNIGWRDPIGHVHTLLITTNTHMGLVRWTRRYCASIWISLSTGRGCSSRTLLRRRHAFTRWRCARSRSCRTWRYGSSRCMRASTKRCPGCSASASRSSGGAGPPKQRRSACCRLRSRPGRAQARSWSFLTIWEACRVRWSRSPSSCRQRSRPA